VERGAKSRAEVKVVKSQSAPPTSHVLDELLGSARHVNNLEQRCEATLAQTSNSMSRGLYTITETDDEGEEGEDDEAGGDGLPTRDMHAPSLPKAPAVAEPAASKGSAAKGSALTAAVMTQPADPTKTSFLQKPLRVLAPTGEAATATAGGKPSGSPPAKRTPMHPPLNVHGSSSRQPLASSSRAPAPSALTPKASSSRLTHAKPPNGGPRSAALHAPSAAAVRAGPPLATAPACSTSTRKLPLDKSHHQERHLRVPVPSVSPPDSWRALAFGEISSEEQEAINEMQRLMERTQAQELINGMLERQQQQQEARGAGLAGAGTAPAAPASRQTHKSASAAARTSPPPQSRGVAPANSAAQASTSPLTRKTTSQKPQKAPRDATSVARANAAPATSNGVADGRWNPSTRKQQQQEQQPQQQQQSQTFGDRRAHAHGGGAQRPPAKPPQLFHAPSRAARVNEASQSATVAGAAPPPQLALRDDPVESEGSATSILGSSRTTLLSSASSNSPSARSSLGVPTSRGKSLADGACSLTASNLSLLEHLAITQEARSLTPRPEDGQAPPSSRSSSLSTHSSGSTQTTWTWSASSAPSSFANPAHVGRGPPEIPASSMPELDAGSGSGVTNGAGRRPVRQAGQAGMRIPGTLINRASSYVERELADSHRMPPGPQRLFARDVFGTRAQQPRQRRQLSLATIDEADERNGGSPPLVKRPGSNKSSNVSRGSGGKKLHGAAAVASKGTPAPAKTPYRSNSNGAPAPGGRAASTNGSERPSQRQLQASEGRTAAGSPNVRSRVIRDELRRREQMVRTST
jgi:hypothetical protein